MRGVYTATVKHSALAAAKDLIVLTAPSGKIVEILDWYVGNVSAETNEQLEAILVRCSAAGTGSATGLAEKPHETGDQAAGSVAEHSYATTQPTKESDPLQRRGVASLAGDNVTAIPEARVYVPSSGIITVRIETATFTAFDCVASITWREIG